jgi:hypothetical protein
MDVYCLQFLCNTSWWAPSWLSSCWNHGDEERLLLSSSDLRHPLQQHSQQRQTAHNSPHWHSTVLLAVSLIDRLRQGTCRRRFNGNLWVPAGVLVTCGMGDKSYWTVLALGTCCTTTKSVVILWSSNMCWTRAHLCHQISDSRVPSFRCRGIHFFFTRLATSLFRISLKRRNDKGNR